jgi:hypothetical protein
MVDYHYLDAVKYIFIYSQTITSCDICYAIVYSWLCLTFTLSGGSEPLRNDCYSLLDTIRCFWVAGFAFFENGSCKLINRCAYCENISLTCVFSPGSYGNSHVACWAGSFEQACGPRLAVQGWDVASSGSNRLTTW